MPVVRLIVNATAVQTVANVENGDGSNVGGVNPNYQPNNPAGSTTPAASQGFQLVVTGSGPVSASAQVVVSNDGVNWTNLSPLITAPAAGGTSSAIGGNSNVPYQFFGAYITAISGTNAKATLTMCA